MIHEAFMLTLIQLHLGDIITRDGVEKDEVFKVGDLSPLPALGHVRCFEQLLRCGQRNTSAMRRTGEEKTKLF